jgi:pimeloyl-ACP methyl ester carboxylesterase
MTTPVVAPATVLLVHGAWHGAWCWAALQAELDRRGVPSLAVDLPGHGASLAPLADLYADATCVAETLARVPVPVVLVGHSYGGAVIGEAATRYHANVKHLVFLAAFCLDEGEGLLPYNQTLPPAHTPLADAIESDEAAGVLTLDPERCVPALYGECAPEVAAAAVARLCPQPIATFLQPVTGAPWKRIPSTYVRCPRDGAIPITSQDVMSARCGSVATIDTDHSPFASRPVETADVLERLAREPS